MPRWLAIYFHRFTFFFFHFLGSLIIAEERGNKRGPRRIAAKGRMVYATYMADRHFIPRIRAATHFEASKSCMTHVRRRVFIARHDEASLWSMPRCRSIFALDHSTNGMDFIRMRDGLLTSKISNLEWNEILIEFKFSLFVFFLVRGIKMFVIELVSICRSVR